MGCGGLWWFAVVCRGLRWFVVVSSSSYCLQYALHMRSIIYCFGGVCAAASTILVVAIAKF